MKKLLVLVLVLMSGSATHANANEQMPSCNAIREIIQDIHKTLPASGKFSDFGHVAQKIAILSDFPEIFGLSAEERELVMNSYRSQENLQKMLDSPTIWNHGATPYEGLALMHIIEDLSQLYSGFIELHRILGSRQNQLDRGYCK